jgi:glycosyltransferase involved in cell wall biosynthesis
MVATNSYRTATPIAATPPVRILVDSLADEGFSNAQITNAREIIRRLDPDRFHISLFYLSNPDPAIRRLSNVRLIRLPRRRQTIRILREFILGSHHILFYLKSAPAGKFYLRLRKHWRDGRITIGTIESQSDLRNEPTLTPGAVRLWEETILRCDFLFSNSQSVRRSLQHEYGLHSEVIETGVDTKFFMPKSGPVVNSRIRVLFAGSLRPFKQSDLLLDAAARFPQADFVIAGDGIMADGLRDTIHNNNLSNVTLLGPLIAQSLREEYQNADVFLFPSKWEGSPKVILEAAACGLPVLARNNYCPETVIDGKTGFLAKNDDELYRRLHELLNNGQLRKSLGTAGRLHSLNFDWDRIALKWQKVFLEVSERKHAAGYRG